MHGGIRQRAITTHRRGGRGKAASAKIRLATWTGLAAATAYLGANASIGAATTFTWATGNGVFGQAANWTPTFGAPPGSLDNATFSNVGSSNYTVTFGADAINAVANVTAGTVAFRSDGAVRTYAVGGLGISGGSLSLTASLGANQLAISMNQNLMLVSGGAACTVAAGNDLTTVGNVSVGSPLTGSTGGSLIVDGTSSTVSQINNATLAIGLASGATSTLTL